VVKNFIAALVTVLITVLFMMIRGLPASVTPWSALLGILVLYLVVRALLWLVSPKDRG
jgi:prepilin signal peptidase PulO-like enzyme (type II secretory pathway)